MLTKEQANRIQTMIDDCVFGDGHSDVRFNFWDVTYDEYDEFMECVFRYIDLDK